MAKPYIKIDIQLNSQSGTVYSYHSRGHSPIDYKELCSALSILEYTYFYSIKTLEGIFLEEELLERGNCKIKIKFIDEKSKIGYNYLCRFLLVGLETLYLDNQKWIELNKICKRNNYGIEER